MGPERQPEDFPSERPQSPDGTEAAPEFTESPDVVRCEELKYIARRRSTARRRRSEDDVAGSLVGLCLSGGGIRSATTNLGILQALSRMGILPLADYLSTVSGGGYIGGCLSALLSINRTSKPGKSHQYKYDDRANLRFGTAWTRFPFNPNLGATAKAGCDTRASVPTSKKIVAHLRTHGDFLIARRGLFTREALRSIGHLVTGAAYNVVTTLLVLFVIGLAAMGVAHAMEPDLSARLSTVPLEQDETVATVTADGAGNPVYQVREPSVVGWEREFSYRFSRAWDDVLYDMRYSALAYSAVYGAAASIVVFGLFALAVRGPRPFKGLGRDPSRAKAGESVDDRWERRLIVLSASIVAAALVLACVLLRAPRVEDGRMGWIVEPVLVLVGARLTNFFLYVLVARTGNWLKLWSRRFRSLWGSFQAVTGYGVVAAVLFACLAIAAHAAAHVTPWALVAPVLSVVAGRFLMSDAAGQAAGRIRIPKGAFRLVLGLLVAVFAGLTVLEAAAAAVHWGFDRPLGDAGPAFWRAALVGGGALLFFSLAGDINRISLHYFYRDRLLETYLRTEFEGASHAAGDPAGTPATRVLETFTDTTDMTLTDLHGVDPSTGGLGNSAPYLLVSAAINLGGSRDLTRKDRRSGYFLFSKYYCGSSHTGYRRTQTYRGGETKLARAITISGAAASTAVGYQTFLAQSFLAAMFNIRLGYWMANPRVDTRGRQGDTWVFWPKYMMREVFGATRETTRLVNLSDGGHTGDNVGIYPLLERRCQVIIACDAEADGGLAFGSFTEALRQAYVDLGVDVDIDLSMLEKDPSTGRSRSHCAIGRIRYPECPDRPNWLVYLKNSMTGDEPAPVVNYHKTHEAFPHESTVDQFFDDAQFESYRALGVHIAESVFSDWARSDEVRHALLSENDAEAVGEPLWTSENAWQDLVHRHMPYRAADDEAFQGLLRELRGLEQLFIETPGLEGYYRECMGLPAVSPAQGAEPQSDEIVHAAAMQIQLMEDAYYSLRLDRYANAPDNRGWMNLFRRWGRSQTFQRYFERLADTFSNDFVDFCHNYLIEWPPDVPVPHPWDPKDVSTAARCYRGSMAEGILAMAKTGARGIFLDPGRRDTGDAVPLSEPGR